MSWFLAGAAAVTVVSQGMAGSASAKGAAKLSRADNEAIIQANVANTIRTGYRMGLANMQRGLQKRQNVQAGFDITRGGVAALGQVDANAAAAGSVGASVDAVANDVRMKIGESQAHLANKAEVDAQNFNTQIEGIAFEGKDAVKGAHKVDIPSSGDIWGGALMAGATQFATSYMAGKMKLGLGDAPSAGGGGSLGGGIDANKYSLGTDKYNWSSNGLITPIAGK